MRKYFYIGPNNQKLGPVEAHKLPSLGVTQNTYVWTEGMRDWDLVRNIRDLDPIFPMTKQAPQSSSSSSSYSQPKTNTYTLNKEEVSPRVVDSYSNRGKCAINAAFDDIPSVGLGIFIEGYTNTRDPFPYKFLWWFFVPFVGQIIVPFFILFYFLFKIFGAKHFVYLYKDGFLWKRNRLIGKDDEVRVHYDDVFGVRTSKTRQYQSIYGLIDIYKGTTVYLEVCNKKYETIISRSFVYKNENEEEDKYNSLGFAMKAIVDKCNEIAIERFNNEMREKKYGLFLTVNHGDFTAVCVGKDFIVSGDNRASKSFKYSFDNGKLLIYPSEEELNPNSKKKYFVIDVNNMYNKEVFLLAASQFLGIK